MSGSGFEEAERAGFLGLLQGAVADETATVGEGERDPNVRDLGEQAAMLEYKQTLVDSLTQLRWERNGKFPTSKRWFSWSLDNNELGIYCPCAVDDYKDDFHISLYDSEREFVWTTPGIIRWYSRSSWGEPDKSRFVKYETFEEWEAAWRRYLQQKTVHL